MQKNNQNKPPVEIEDPQTEIEQLSDHLRQYISLRRELFELKLWDKISGATSAAIAWGLIIFFGAISFFLLSAGLAWLVGMSAGQVYIGFLVVAGALGLLATLIYLGRNKFLQKPLTDRFIEHLVNEEYDEEEKVDSDENNQSKAA